MITRHYTTTCNPDVMKRFSLFVIHWLKSRRVILDNQLALNKFGKFFRYLFNRRQLHWYWQKSREREGAVTQLFWQIWNRVLKWWRHKNEISEIMAFVRIFCKNNVHAAYLPKMSISGKIVSEMLAGYTQKTPYKPFYWRKILHVTCYANK